MTVSTSPRMFRSKTGLTWEGMRWALFNPVAGDWHPLTVLSHMVDCQLFGLNPWGHHLTNVLLHALNAGLVFVLLQQMTGAMWRSLLVAALFAVHPLRVESVAWVAERKDVLSGCFGLLALMAYARYARSRSLKSKVQSPKSVVRGHAVSLPSSVFHLLSPLPVLLRPGLDEQADAGDVAVCDVAARLLAAGENAECRMRMRMQATDTHHATRIRFTLRSCCSKSSRSSSSRLSASVVTFVVQKRGGALAAGESLPLGARVGNALISYCRYLGKLFWPTDLAVYVSAPRALAAGEGAAGGRGDPGHFGAGLGAAAAVSLFADGVAVVLRDAGAGESGWCRQAARRWRIGVLIFRHLGC